MLGKRTRPVVVLLQDGIVQGVFYSTEAAHDYAEGMDMYTLQETMKSPLSTKEWKKVCDCSVHKDPEFSVHSGVTH